MALSPVQEEFRRSLVEKLATGAYRLEIVDACLCGSREAVGLLTRDRYGIATGLVICESCALARTSPRLATEHLPSFYENEYHGLHQGVREPSPETALYMTGQGEQIATFLGELLPPGAIRVADIGCGTGQVLREFVAAMGDREVRAAGCEYSSAFARVGRGAGSDIRQGGPETLVELAPFNIVLLSHVVEHFPNPVAEMEAIRRLGDDGTLFYVEVPGILTLDTKAQYAYRLDQYFTLAHTYHFTLGTLEATMSRAGFKLVRGDEGVRGAFLRTAPSNPEIDGGELESVLAYLRQLSGPRARLRQVWPQSRQFLAAYARHLPAPVYDRLRRVARHR
jgi:SAM-dependent methyltransferase